MRSCFRAFFFVGPAALIACTSDTFTSNDAGGDAAAACPAISGQFAVAVTGLACPSAPDTSLCIEQNACSLKIDGTVIQGTIDVGADGALTNGAITEGTLNRTGCVGAWNGAKSALVVDCGGVATTQSCRVTLTRSSTTCK